MLPCRKKKLPVTTLLRAIGYNSDKDIIDIFNLADEIEVTPEALEANKGRKLAAKVLKTWVEDFEDEDTGEVIPIERTNPIVERGEVLDDDSIAAILDTLSYRFKWENVLSYNFTINDDHDFALTAVSEWSKNRTERVTATATGFDSDSFGYHNLGAGTGTPTVSSSYVGNQKMSYVARANYSYKGKYLASVSARWDGCSVLADGNKWDIFPAAAIGWRISDEPFMQSLTAISDMKIRASYGVTGNAGAGAKKTSSKY